jgi:hypothetical protein
MLAFVIMDTDEELDGLCNRLHIFQVPLRWGRVHTNKVFWSYLCLFSSREKVGAARTMLDYSCSIVL